MTVVPYHNQTNIEFDFNTTFRMGCDRQNCLHSIQIDHNPGILSIVGCRMYVNCRMHCYIVVMVNVKDYENGTEYIKMYDFSNKAAIKDSAEFQCKFIQ